MKRLLPLLFVLLASNASVAQDHKEAYGAFRKQALSSYSDFRSKCNERYAAFLEQAWKSFQCKEPLLKPKDDSPVPPVVYDDKQEGQRDDKHDGAPEGQINKDREVVPLKVVNPPAITPQPQPVSPVEDNASDKDAQLFSFCFYGTDMCVRMGELNRFTMKGTTEQDVADAWRYCSGECFNGVLNDCLSLRNKHALCDWAYLSMLRCLCSEFYGDGSSEATCVSAYLFSQSGYQMKLARSEGGKLYMLIGSRHIIYEQPYYTFDNFYYTPLDCDESSLRICQGSFPREQSISFWIDKSMRLKESATDMRILKSAKYPEAEVRVHVNRNLVNFFNDYPSSQMEDDYMTRWAIYANTPLSPYVADELYPKLREILAGKGKAQAVAMLLDFVQTAFVYEYDDKIWGCDRPFFAEETLYYPYCDCEDRSVLFSRLVRDLLGLRVILVYYPGHLATAVCLEEDVSGDCIMVGGERYTICDPTYIGAPVGRTMPGMDNAAANVILLR